jgi:Spy/CpxP family protein refolding chaperone
MMNKFVRLCTGTVAALALAFSVGRAFAQPGGDPGGGPGGPPGGMGGGMGFGNMDPQQMRQQMQDMMVQAVRDQLAVTNDDEWRVIQDRLTKLVQIRMDSMAGGMGGMFRVMGRGRGGMGGMGGPGGGGGGRRGMFGQSSQEEDALQNAIDNTAPDDQVAAALAKLRAARKAKQAELAKAQQALKDVLSPRQEAVMVSLGMLD